MDGSENFLSISGPRVGAEVNEIFLSIFGGRGFAVYGMI